MKDTIAEKLDYLRQQFNDLLNYESDDPTDPIDPITYQTPEGDSCLHIAAMRGDAKSIQYLIQMGLDVNSLGDLGNTPLHYACQFQKSSAASLLLSLGADPDARNELGKRAGRCSDAAASN